MTALILLIIVIVCVAYQYLKGSLIGAVVSVIITICSGILAFAYFELLAGLIAAHMGDAMMPWTRLFCFIISFIIAFAVLQTIASKLIKKSVEFDPMPERIGRCLCGAFYGFILTGLLLIALGMAPLPNKYPYQRFAPVPNPERPNKAALNPDGFFCSLFSIISRGSMSGKTSFAVIHPSFLDESYLNRHAVNQKISLLTEKPVITVPTKDAAWLAPDTLKNKDGTNVTSKTGHNLTVVRIGISLSSRRFTTSQLRLICKENSGDGNNLKGKAVNIYPLGYISDKDRLETKHLNEVIELAITASADREKLVDFVFDVPNDYSPSMVVFKQNSIAKVPKLISTDEAPIHVPF